MLRLPIRKTVGLRVKASTATLGYSLHEVQYGNRSLWQSICAESALCSRQDPRDNRERLSQIAAGLDSDPRARTGRGVYLHRARTFAADDRRGASLRR